MKISKKARQLAEDLGLNEAQAQMMVFKADLYKKCSKTIQSSDLTHKEIAIAVGTSPARITRLANNGENSVSIEMLIKIIYVINEKMPVKIAI